MAPMAGRITDGNEYELILLSGLVPSLLRPGVPVHRVMGMLLEVKAWFVDEVVGFFGHIRAFTGADKDQQKGEQGISQGSQILKNLFQKWSTRKEINI